MSKVPEQAPLFVAEPGAPATAARPPGEANARNEVRLKRPERFQREFVIRDLDALLEPDHRARAMWKVAERLDLSALYKKIEARGSNAGAPAIDPVIPLVLWIYATSEGVGSAREIADLCERHDAYRWICGGVSVKSHHLSDFRSRNGGVFSDLITQVVAPLLKHDICELFRIAQDGTRVRANAGAASFRKGETLERLREEAKQHLESVLAEAESPSHSSIKRIARARGARERLARIEAALNEIPQVAEVKARNGSDDAPRVSTTDPRTRVMKMPDGGFRPAVNVQFATTADAARIIVGVDVTNSGSDQGEAVPMLEAIEKTYGERPAELLVDGGYVSHDQIEAAAAGGTLTLAPLPKTKEGQRPAAEPRSDDSVDVAEWRARMQTESAKTTYRLRASTAECVNADGKAHRGLASVPIRGLPKAFAWACLFALSYDILRTISLGAHL
jgi:transposase